MTGTAKEQREAFERALTGTLTRTIDFLKFAETKNAALLTFASAWLLSLANLLTGEHELSQGVYISVTVSLFLFALSALVALSAFLPKADLNAFHRVPDREKSLLFFGDIAGFDSTAYVQRVRQRYLLDGAQAITDQYLDDLAVQVAANSDITMSKLTTFRWAARLVALALLGISTACVIVAYNHLWAK